MLLNCKERETKQDVLPNLPMVDTKSLKSPVFRSDQASWASSLLSPSAITFKREKNRKDDMSNGRASSPPLVSFQMVLRISMLSSQWDP